jgi:hypothetical protein
MTASAGQGRGCSDLQDYEIRLQGHLDPRWAGRLGGLVLTLGSDGTTTLTGQFPDQAALHGLLNRVRDLGLPIVSIQRLCTGEKEATP